MDAANNMSRETMIGVLLAIPLFMQYFNQHMRAIKGSKNPLQVVSTLQKMSTLQYASEADSELMVMKTRSLLCGTIPILEPRSDDSVSTVQMSNHKRLTNTPHNDNDKTPMEPPTEICVEMASGRVAQVTPPRAAEEASIEVVPILSVEHSAPCVTPEPAERKAPIYAPERSVPCVTPDELKPMSTPSKQFPVESISVITPETEPEEDTSIEEDTSEGSSDSSMNQTTSEYLESVARTLAKRAAKVSHNDKVGIAQAMVELGDILFKDDSHKSAMKVYKRAELVQKIIVDETIASVASAMKGQASYHKKHGNLAFSDLYGNMANELAAHATPANLQKCIKLHHDYKPHGHVDKEFASLVRKLDRRLKRAGTEAVPLVSTLKKQAACCAALRS